MDEGGFIKLVHFRLKKSSPNNTFRLKFSLCFFFYSISLSDKEVSMENPPLPCRTRSSRSLGFTGDTTADRKLALCLVWKRYLDNRKFLEVLETLDDFKLIWLIKEKPVKEISSLKKIHLRGNFNAGNRNSQPYGKTRPYGETFWGPVNLSASSSTANLYFWMSISGSVYMYSITLGK